MIPTNVLKLLKLPKSFLFELAEKKPQSLNGKSKWTGTLSSQCFCIQKSKGIDRFTLGSKQRHNCRGGKKKLCHYHHGIFWDMWGYFFRVDLAQANKIRPIQSHGSTFFSDESDTQDKTMKCRFVLCQHQLGSSILHRHVRLSKIFIDPWHLILHVTRHGCRCQSLDSH